MDPELLFRMYYGPEYISATLQAWARRRQIHVEYIQPGKPQQNAYVERYNRTVRYDWLSHYLFAGRSTGVRNEVALDIQS